MKILSVNAGSSSLKFTLFLMPEGKELIGGYFEKILFFVSEDRKSEPDSVLENQAERYAKDSCALKYRRRILTWDTAKFALKMAISAGIGLAVGILLL